MESKETILFIPRLRYLANPTYHPVAQKLEDYHKVYLNTSSDVEFEQQISEAEKEKLLSIYDNYEEVKIGENPKEIKSAWLEYNYFKRWLKRFRKTVSQYNVKAAILPSDKSFEYRALKIYYPNIQLIVLQTCQVKYDLQEISFKQQLKYFLFFHLLKVPIYSKNHSFGLQYPDTSILLLWGEKWMPQNAGDNAFQIRVTGAPAMDKFAGLSKTNEEIQEKIDGFIISDGKRVGCIVLGKSLKLGKAAFEEFIEIYKELIKNSQGYFFIVKIHPLEDGDYCSGLFSEIASDNVIIDQSTPIQKILKKTDFVITQWSSVINEALFMNIPVVLCNPDNKYDLKERFLEDFKFVAPDAIQLSNLINWILEEGQHENKEFRKQYLERSFAFVNGQSTEKTVRAIRDIIESGKVLEN